MMWVLRFYTLEIRIGRTLVSILPTSFKALLTLIKNFIVALISSKLASVFQEHVGKDLGDELTSTYPWAVDKVR